jgi:hypothetical protein
MKTIDILTRLIIVAVLTAFIAVVFIQSNKWLMQTAVQGCLLVGQDEYVYPESNSKAVVPNLKAYRQCMDEKGY